MKTGFDVFSPVISALLLDNVHTPPEVRQDNSTVASTQALAIAAVIALTVGNAFTQTVSEVKESPETVEV